MADAPAGAAPSPVVAAAAAATAKGLALGSAGFWQEVVSQLTVSATLAPEGEAKLRAKAALAEAEGALAKAKVALAESKVALAEAELRQAPAEGGQRAAKERALAEAKYEVAKAAADAAPNDPRKRDEEATARKAFEALLTPAAAVDSQRLRRADPDDAGLAPFLFGVARYCLPDGVPAPGSTMTFTQPLFNDRSTPTHQLYVRECYASMFEEVQEYARPENKGDGCGGVVVLGTPGIGKSGFGIYALARFGQTRPVFYQRFDTNKRFLLVQCDEALANVRHAFDYVREMGLYEVPTSISLSDLTVIRNIVAVVDPGPAEVVRHEGVFQLVVSSPNENRLRHFLKTTGTTLKRVMPKWTEEELLHLVPMHATEADRQDANRLAALRVRALDAFDFFGGVPRYVFAVDKFRTDVEEAIKKARLEDLINALCNGEPVKGELGAALIHTVPNPAKVGSTRWEVASAAIGRLLVRALVTSGTNFYGVLFASTGNEPALQALRGYALEYFAHHALATGGTFYISELGDEDAPDANFTPRVLPKLPVVNFERKTMADLSALAENQLAVPLVRNFESVDSFAPLRLALLTGAPADTRLVCAGFQMTTAAEHGVKGAGLKRVRDKVRALTGDARLPTCVVFVTTRTGIRKRQRLTAAGGGAYAGRALGEVRQFAIKLGDEFDRLASIWERARPGAAAAAAAGVEGDEEEEEEDDGVE